MKVNILALQEELKTKSEIEKFISKVSKNLTKLKVSNDYLDAKTNGYKISKNEFVKRYSEFLIDNAPLKNDYDMNELKYYWIKDKRNFMSCKNSNKTLFCLEKPLNSISPSFVFSTFCLRFCSVGLIPAFKSDNMSLAFFLALSTG